MREVLVVEDDLDTADVLGDILAGYDYRSVKVHSGMEALEVLRAHPGRFGLMLLDWWMPKMDGGDLLASMAKMTVAIPVIVLSGARAPNNTPHPWLLKPFEMGTLLGLVEQHFAR